MVNLWWGSEPAGGWARGAARMSMNCGNDATNGRLETHARTPAPREKTDDDGGGRLPTCNAKITPARIPAYRTDRETRSTFSSVQRMSVPERRSSRAQLPGVKPGICRRRTQNMQVFQCYMVESAGVEPARPEGLVALAPRCLAARPTLLIVWSPRQDSNPRHPG